MHLINFTRKRPFVCSMRLHGNSLIWEDGQPISKRPTLLRRHKLAVETPKIAAPPISCQILKSDADLATKIEPDTSVPSMVSMQDETDFLPDDTTANPDLSSEREYQPKLDGDVSADSMYEHMSEQEMVCEPNDHGTPARSEDTLFVIASELGDVAPRYRQFTNDDCPRLYLYNGRQIRSSPFTPPPTEFDRYSAQSKARAHILSQFAKSMPKSRRCQICHMTFDDEEAHIACREHQEAMSQNSFVSQNDELQQLLDNMSNSFLSSVHDS